MDDQAHFYSSFFSRDTNSTCTIRCLLPAPLGFLRQEPPSGHPTTLIGDEGEAFDMDFVYSTRGKLVPVVHDSRGKSSSTVHQVTAKPPLAKTSVVASDSSGNQALKTPVIVDHRVFKL